MNALSIPVIMMAGILFYAGFNYLFIYYRRRFKHREDLTFALTSLAMGMYDVVSFYMYNATSITEGAYYLRVQAAIICLIGAAFVWFVMDYLELKLKRTRNFFSVLFTFFAIYIFIDRSPITFDTTQPHIKKILFPFFKLEATYYEVASGPFIDIIGLIGGLFFLYILFISVRRYWQNGGFRAKSLSISLVIFLAGLCNDLAVVIGLYQFIYVIEYAFISIIVLMAYSLSNTIAESSIVKEELYTERNLLHTLIETLPDRIYVKDTQGQFLIVNAAVCHKLGVEKPEDVVGKTDFDFYQKEMAERYFADDMAVIESREAIIDKEESSKDSVGNPKWTLTTKIPLKDDEGKVIGLVGVGHDITERKQIEETLRKKQEELVQKQNMIDIMMSTIPDVIYFKDRKSRFIRISRSQADRFGLHNPEEAVGKNDFDFFSEEHARQAYEDEQDIIRTMKPVLNIEEKETWPDQPDTWVSTTKMPLRNDKGEIVGTFGISRDITERKQWEEKLEKANEALEEQRNMLRALIDNVPDRIYYKDKESRFVINNLAHLHAMGVSTQEEVVGKTDFDIFPHELAELYYNDEQKVIRSGLPLKEKEEPTEDQPTGEKKWVLTYKEPLCNIHGKIIGLVGISRDITERKKAQEKLARQAQKLKTANKELQQSNRELERAQQMLGKTNIELHQSNEELQQFAYVASHDLQEPLRMISSYLSLINRRYTDKLDKDGKEFIEYAVDGAKRLQVMINDLLQYSRVTTQGKPFKETDIEKVFGKVLMNLKIAIEESKGEVTHDALPVVMADEIQMERLLQNLLGNAVKYRGERKPKVHVSVKRKKGEYEFSVQDNGIGIEEEYREKIFGIFQRLHTREEYPGTGIGLAICKKIVERHGGKIWVGGKFNEGSTFYFTLSKIQNVS